MRVLLDEQLPRQLARALLTEAEQAGFEVFLTRDRNLEHQQNLRHRRLGVVVLAAPSNALARSRLSGSNPREHVVWP